MLDLKQLPPESLVSDKFHKIQTPLVSVKRLCDSDLEVRFKGKQVTVTNHLGTTILAGVLDPKTELCMVQLHDNISPSDNVSLPEGDTMAP